MAKPRHKLTHKTEWGTPDEILDAVRKIIGDIDLDPASTKEANKRVKAKIYYDSDSNGLEQDWFGSVFLNPPYARGVIDKFVDKFVAEIARGEMKRLIMLTNNDTDTKWCQKLLKHMDAVCFIKGRVAFLNEEGTPVDNNMQGQALWYYGDNIDKFKAETFKLGPTLIIPYYYN